MDLKYYAVLMGVNLFKECSFNQLLSVVWGVHRLLGVKNPCFKALADFFLLLFLFYLTIIFFQWFNGLLVYTFSVEIAKHGQRLLNCHSLEWV